MHDQRTVDIPVIPPLFIRAVPGLGNSLHATGTDNESALHNAISASFPSVTPATLLLAQQINVTEKLGRLESPEHNDPEFVEYFCKCKLEDTRDRMAK